MHSDRELLELAAKAARYNVSWCNGCQLIDGQEDPWDPLSNDGDALRLAVNLSIHIRLWWYAVEAEDNDGRSTGMIHARECNNNMDAATRRAIVRAAASIGEAMQ